jgi:hypothetical protein
MILAISPFSNFFTFTIQKDDGGTLSSINLENIKESYLVFEDSGNLVKIESLISKGREGLNEGIISFLISQTDARRIIKFKSRNYVVTILEQRIDGVLDESPIYEGTWILYERRAENAYNIQNVKLTTQLNDLTKKLNLLNTNIEQLKNENASIQGEILTVRETNSGLQATLNQRESELAKILASPNNKGANTSPTNTAAIN